MYRYLLVAVLAAPLLGATAADVTVSGQLSVRDRNQSVDIVFTDNDKTTIQNYYRTSTTVSQSHGKRGKKIPPGLAKKGGLPPGLAKRQRLPDNVEYEVLPRALEAKLPPLPSPNYVRVRVGQDFAILDKRTRVVLDMAIGLPI